MDVIRVINQAGIKRWQHSPMQDLPWQLIFILLSPDQTYALALCAFRSATTDASIHSF